MNTKLFHNFAQRKRAKAKIFSIEENGILISEPKLLADFALSYFFRVLSDNILVSEETSSENFEKVIDGDSQ